MIGNLDKNFNKHKVTNQEAEEVFAHNPKFIFQDPKHSTSEKRYMLWGITNTGRKLSVIYTERGERIRIISARDMNKKERNAYEKKV